MCVHRILVSIISCSQFPDTFALANLFQVIESNMGIIGSCLPILRQPLRTAFPRIFGTAPVTSGPARPYYDDRFTEDYVMQNFSDKKSSGKRTWHDVSVSGPELFKSTPRKSDEMQIIHNGAEFDEHSGGSMNEATGGPDAHRQIRKETSYSVNVAGS